MGRLDAWVSYLMTILVFAGGAALLVHFIVRVAHGVARHSEGTSHVDPRARKE